MQLRDDEQLVVSSCLAGEYRHSDWLWTKQRRLFIGQKQLAYCNPEDGIDFRLYHTHRNEVLAALNALLTAAGIPLQIQLRSSAFYAHNTISRLTVRLKSGQRYFVKDFV